MARSLDLHSAEETIIEVPGVGILLAYGTSVPSDAAAGYATGCLYLKTDGGDATSAYVNEGSSTSANFNAITVAA